MSRGRGTVNKVFLVGRLGADPQVKNTPAGQAVANFNLAKNYVWKYKDGNQQDKTDWHRIQAWGKLAEIMGEKEMAARRKARIDKAVEAMREHMWDQEAGTFLSVERESMKKVPVATIGSWIPLHAGIPTKAQAKRMAEAVQTPSWQTPLPVPTVDRRDKRFKASGFWRGDVWPPTNYQVASGLAAYGHKDLASDIADKTVANAIKNGISEYYDSISGKTLGVDFLGMTCTVVTMMLDGLCRKHKLEVRKTR